ncbi:MAG TPA: glycoside hydrolase family 71/99-like protein [Isosphaeraceae bacterium]
MRRIAIATTLVCVWCLSGPGTRGDDGPEQPARPLILAHYMPWFQTKDVGGTWGWHWTMGHFDPERSDPTGRRDIASHHYPLIGPYDSADPDVLEYHALLMRIAGIDGVIADWYGSEDVNDYAMIHRRTASLFDALGRRGLKFAVCYEDRVLKLLAERWSLSPEQAVEHARTHLRFCEATWFEAPGYVTWRGKPLLLVFGPESLRPAQWEELFSGLRRPPAFFTLHERRPPAIGSFAWPPMWAAKGGVLDAEGLDEYLDRFDGRDGVKIGGAFPGFHDIYQQAGVQPSHGTLDPRAGATFRHTLDRALRSGGPFVQVITWNDFGEGTDVEPTREFGYRHLEAIQRARQSLAGEPLVYRPADLRLPQRIHRLRERVARSSPRGKALDEVVDLLFAADVARASQRLDQLERAAASPPAPAQCRPESGRGSSPFDAASQHQ